MEIKAPIFWFEFRRKLIGWPPNSFWRVLSRFHHPLFLKRKKELLYLFTEDSDFRRKIIQRVHSNKCENAVKPAMIKYGGATKMNQTIWAFLNSEKLSNQYVFVFGKTAFKGEDTI